MADEELEDAPPDLVAVGSSDENLVTGLENNVQDLSIVKVPITIVTG